MIANLENLEAVYTHTICLEDRNFASFLCSKINLIKEKIINRVEFVYIFELHYCNLGI